MKFNTRADGPSNLRPRMYMLSLILLAVALNAHSQESMSVRQEHKTCQELSKPGTYPDYDALPTYFVYRRHYSATTPKTLEFHVSISPAAAESETSYERLACEFQSRFATETAVEVWIFDDHKSARSLALLATDQPNHGIFLWHLRGHYVADKSNGQQFIEFLLPEAFANFLAFEHVKVDFTKR